MGNKQAAPVPVVQEPPKITIVTYNCACKDHSTHPSEPNTHSHDPVAATPQPENNSNNDKSRVDATQLTLAMKPSYIADPAISQAVAENKEQTGSGTNPPVTEEIPRKIDEFAGSSVQPAIDVKPTITKTEEPPAQVILPVPESPGKTGEGVLSQEPAIESPSTHQPQPQPPPPAEVVPTQEPPREELKPLELPRNNELIAPLEPARDLPKEIALPIEPPKQNLELRELQKRKIQSNVTSADNKTPALHAPTQKTVSPNEPLKQAVSGKKPHPKTLSPRLQTTKKTPTPSPSSSANNNNKKKKKAVPSQNLAKEKLELKNLKKVPDQKDEEEEEEDDILWEEGWKNPDIKSKPKSVDTAKKRVDERKKMKKTKTSERKSKTQEIKPKRLTRKSEEKDPEVPKRSRSTK